jgi:hypothetical protein
MVQKADVSGNRGPILYTVSEEEDLLTVGSVADGVDEGDG